VDTFYLEEADLVADPYPYYALLREVQPVSWSEGADSWALCRYRDVAMALGDPRFSLVRVTRIVERVPPERRHEAALLSTMLSKWLFYLDPPPHTRLRQHVMRAFTPAIIKRQENRVQERVDALLDACAGRSEIDLMRDFALPLPAVTVSDILGSSVDLPRLVKWSSHLADFIGKVDLTPEDVTGACESAEQMAEHFRHIMAEREREPGEDLISAMLAARERDASITDDEIIGLCALIIGAGQETTSNLIGNGMNILLENPGLADDLRAHPEKLPTAIEEFLRCESPVQITARVMLEDVEIDAMTLRKGQHVSLMLGAANRDDDQFPDPDVVDLERTPNRHLALGSGPHFCLGAYLARLQARHAFAALLARFPQMRLKACRRHANISFRGVEALEVEPG
jgi:cytochrome P450